MKKIHWINCAKFIAILAVLTDHTYNILYANKDYRILSYFSVSLFILLSGQTAYLSICKNPMGWFKTFINMSKKLVSAYSVSVFIYMMVRHRFFAARTYLDYLIHFNVVGAHYFVFLYLLDSKKFYKKITLSWHSMVSLSYPYLRKIQTT